MRILFIEDEAPARSGLMALLAQGGDSVDVAETCEEADAALRATEYDLVILDIMLPPGTYERGRGMIMRDAGVALLEDLRRGRIANSKTAVDVPVIALTAVSNLAIHERIQAHAGVQMIEKPIDPEEVVELIRSVFSEQNPSPNNGMESDE